MSKRRIGNISLLKISILLLIVCFWGFVDIPVMMTISQVLFVVSFGISVFQNRNNRIVSAEYLIWGFIWLSWCILSVLWSHQQNAAISTIMAVIQVVSICIMMTIVVRDSRMLNFLISAIIFAGVILSVRLIIVTPISEWGEDRFGTAIGMHVNAVSMNMLASELFSVFRFMTTPNENKSGRRKRLLYIFLSFLFAALIIATASKKTAVFMVLGPVLMFLFSRNKVNNRWKRLIVLFVVVGLALFLINTFPVLFVAINDRMEGLINFLTRSGVVDKSTADRQYLMVNSFRVFLEHPIIGVGIGNNRFHNILGLYAHSNPIEIMANLGFIGLFIYYSIYAVTLKKLHKINKKSVEARLLEIIFVCLAMMEFVCVIYETESNQIVIATIWIASTILYREYSESAKANLEKVG